MIQNATTFLEAIEEIDRGLADPAPGKLSSDLAWMFRQANACARAIGFLLGVAKADAVPPQESATHINGERRRRAFGHILIYSPAASKAGDATARKLFNQTLWIHEEVFDPTGYAEGRSLENSEWRTLSEEDRPLDARALRAALGQWRFVVRQMAAAVAEPAPAVAVDQTPPPPASGKRARMLARRRWIAARAVELAPLPYGKRIAQLAAECQAAGHEPISERTAKDDLCWVKSNPGKLAPSGAILPK